MRTAPSLVRPPRKRAWYTFGVQAAADNWVKAKRQYTMTIDTAFTIDETEAYLDEEFFAAIQSDMVNVDNYSQGVVYSLKEGKLPAGLSAERKRRNHGYAVRNGQLHHHGGCAGDERGSRGLAPRDDGG